MFQIGVMIIVGMQQGYFEVDDLKKTWQLNVLNRLMVMSYAVFHTYTEVVINVFAESPLSHISYTQHKSVKIWIPIASAIEVFRIYIVHVNILYRIP